ncbi:ferredoxin-NADP reductase [Exilibacterium tricleocarpae]|uniref:Ferredoxin-NADP reductase n=1 Tax=Exilibacterium tricleocarpae TaxID=2591008 RepID=A0A545U9K6_9GAMM|nr:FAD-binding oxidoreductase [Exilibacterium tricleocarpae]TQV86147.1 ferredoxin-NADP reductase [Exilibacterium tricleocarpae]
MRLQDYDTGATYKATVLSNTRITPAASPEEVREIVLEVQQQAFEYRIGQSIGVIVPGSDEIGHRHHFRLYSVADTADWNNNGKPEVKLCVKRCSYIDAYSGEEYRGIASNYLCDLQSGASLTINGPFGSPFPVPEDKDTDLLLIGMGTGIAPFRAFIKHLYRDVGDWRGRVRLFYGARSGIELLYMNNEKDDFGQYYDEETFEAIKALSPRPHWSDPVAMDSALEQWAEELFEMLTHKKGYSYIAGRMDIQATLDKVFGRIAGSAEKWQQIKSELIEEDRWIELIY